MSDNVYADLGFDNPEEMLAKSKVAVRISQAITSQKLRRVDAAKIMGITRSEVANILRGFFGRYSIQDLERFADNLHPTENPSS